MHTHIQTHAYKHIHIQTEKSRTRHLKRFWNKRIHMSLKVISKTTVKTRRVCERCRSCIIKIQYVKNAGAVSLKYNQVSQAKGPRYRRKCWQSENIKSWSDRIQCWSEFPFFFFRCLCCILIEYNIFSLLYTFLNFLCCTSMKNTVGNSTLHCRIGIHLPPQCVHVREL